MVSELFLYNYAAILSKLKILLAAAQLLFAPMVSPAELLKTKIHNLIC